MSDTEPKVVTKKMQAFKIFDEEMEKRRNGVYADNRSFRFNVLARMKSELGASVASAATMYNEAKKAAEKADPTVGLGRDTKPSATTVVSSGVKRTRKKKDDNATTTNDAVANTAAGTGNTVSTNATDTSANVDDFASAFGDIVVDTIEAPPVVASIEVIPENKTVDAK